MGRTVVPFSQALEAELQRFSKYRRTLRKRDQKLFDELFEFARLHVQACVQGSFTDPIEPILLSICLELLRKIRDLEAKVSGDEIPLLNPRSATGED